jgi:isochorismate synthase EntC
VVTLVDGAVQCHPLAGTVSIPADSEGLDYDTWLQGSTKNLFEHRVVVEEIVSRLEPLCSDVRNDDQPSIVRLRTLAHLGTWIDGKYWVSRRWRAPSKFWRHCTRLPPLADDRPT